MGSDSGFNIPPELVGRDALHAFRGYHHQLEATVEAWLKLPGGGALLVEAGEDFALAAANAIELVQVKDTPSRAVTLHSAGVLQLLESFWRTRSANPNLRLYASFLTTGAFGRERGLHFPQGQTGLQYWSSVADGGDVEPLRVALLQLPLPDAMLTWLRTADAPTMRHELLERIRFESERPASTGLGQALLHAIRSRRAGQLTVREGRRAIDQLLIHVLRAAAGLEVRRLDPGKLEALIDDAIMVQMRADQVRALARENTFRPPLHLRERDGDGGRLFFFAAENRIPLQGRADELALLRAWLADPADFNWTLLAGPGGSGKSRLALELCLWARAAGWSAGFLSATSPYSTPEQFTRFEPDAATLMVVDYAGDDPRRASLLVRTLIERAIAGDLSARVRVLLLERAGAGGSWYSKFVGDAEGLLNGFSTKLSGSEHLRLRPLSSHALTDIVRHVAHGVAHHLNDSEIASSLADLDPHGRPLFAALAGHALRHGEDLRTLDRDGLVRDLVARERRRWRMLAKSDHELEQHLNAAALATLVGPLDLRLQAHHVSGERFPFSEERFNPELMRAIDGGDDPDRILPIEPDIVGEWFVLEQLKGRTPFDRTRDEIITAATNLAGMRWDASAALAAFRVRAYEDFPREALALNLLEPPIDPPTFEAASGWLWTAVNVLPQLTDDAPSLARAMVDSVRRVGGGLADYIGIRHLTIEALASFARALAATDQLEAEAIFFELATESARLADELPEAGRTISGLGGFLGVRKLMAGHVEGARMLFDVMRNHALHFEGVADDFEEIANDVSWLGVSIRSALLAMPDTEQDVRHLELALWAKPARDFAVDLAAATGEVLMGRAQHDDLGPPERVFEELKARSLQRPDRKVLAFWAANTGFVAARDLQLANSAAAMFDTVASLIAWIAPRENWPDMSDVVAEMIELGWCLNDFRYGPATLDALFTAWSEALSAATQDGGDGRRHNSFVTRTAQLRQALSALEEMPFAKRIDRQMREAMGAMPPF